MSEENWRKSSNIPPHQLYYLLMVLAALILASSAAIEYNNSVRSAPLYLFLLVFGIAMTIVLGMFRGGLLALLLISIWITVKQVTGVWSEDRLLFNLIEMVTAALTFIMGGVYRERLQVLLNAYAEAQSQQKKLDLEDTAIGLIKASVGLLRLNEEEDRSVRYKRPFSLILMLMLPVPEVKWGPEDSIGIMRALATTIKDTTRDVDIPFLAAPDKIALILPETEIAGANKVVSNIVKHMIAVKFLTQSGIVASIKDYAQIRFGFATFLGQSNSKINMLEAAENSLQKSLETNTGDLFQNLFIEWKTLGESRISTPLFGQDIRDLTPVREKTDGPDGSSKSSLPEDDETKNLIDRIIGRLRSL